MKPILLVEDEEHLAFALRLNLEAEGYEVFTAANGRLGWQLFSERAPFSAIILDVMLPDIDGFTLATRIREVDHTTGILILTALGEEEDKLRGLSLGVDDFVQKPFHLKELMMRIRRMASRSEFFQPQISHRNVTILPGVELDLNNLLLKNHSQTHHLTSLEADLLLEFHNHQEQVLSRKYLLEKVWGLNGDIETRTIDNFVLRLRRLIEPDPSNPVFIQSCRGRGYKLTAAP